MSKRTQDLFDEALSLSPDERAELADRILGTLEPTDSLVEEAWDAEIQRRVAELNEESVTPVSWGKVRASLEAKLKQIGAN